MHLRLLLPCLGLASLCLNPLRAQSAPASLPPASLDQLLAPIALYPDPLISIILPASAFPADLAAAASFLSGGGNSAQVDNQPWDASVKALAHYPQVVTWMTQNADWTQTLGAAFAAQPADVMASVQRLRTTAQAAGTLTNNPQQQVVTDDGAIEIQPAQPDVIYVPEYDPAVVFVDRPYYGYGGPFLTYSAGYPVGPWLTYGAFWGGGVILTADWGFWHGPGGWWRPAYPPRGEWRGGRGGFAVDARFGAFHSWQYPPGRPRPEFSPHFQPGRAMPGPRPMNGERRPPAPPRAAYRDPRTGASVGPALGPRGASSRGESPHPAEARGAPPAQGRAIQGPGRAQAVGPGTRNNASPAQAERRTGEMPRPSAAPSLPRNAAEPRSNPGPARSAPEAARPAPERGAVREHPQRPNPGGQPGGRGPAPAAAPRPAPHPAPAPARPAQAEHER